MGSTAQTDGILCHMAQFVEKSAAQSQDNNYALLPLNLKRKPIGADTPALMGDPGR